jgi:hypothetical protein
MKKQGYLTIFFLALSSLSSVGLARGEGGGVVATMGDISISIAEVRSLIAFQDEAEKRNLTDNPSKLTALIRNEAIRRAIVAEGKKKDLPLRLDGKKTDQTY